MKTKKQQAQIFLALVPHRDVRLVLRNYSGALFKAGFAGAFHFPWAAPLACVSQPLDAAELKDCARAVRKTAGGGKICAEQMSACLFAAAGENMALLGLRLEFAITPNDLAIQKVTDFFKPHVLGACLLSDAESKSACLPSPPKLAFRAAAVANMFWRPVMTGDNVIGYKWKIGELFWLPKSVNN